MTNTNRGVGASSVSGDEAARRARRRARAADSRRRALMGDGANPAVDGDLALQPVTEPAASPTESAPGRRTTTKVRKSPVAPPEPVTTARAPFIASMLALLAVGIVGLLVLNTAINENAFTLQDLRNSQEKLDASEQRLDEELSQLEAPGNLAAAADRLGLGEPNEITYLRLPDGKELKMPQPGGN